MVKTRSRPEKDTDTINTDTIKKPKLSPKPKKNPTLSDEPAAAPSPDRIQRLLEPFTKDQLIDFLLDAATTDPDTLSRIRAVADTDVSHRKVFVHGLGWDTTRETLLEAFQPFGPIEECNAVTDKATGRTKGYGFVLFQTRADAIKALEEPQKMIKNRLTHSQLASLGVPAGGPAGGIYANADERRVYVSNVHPDASPEKLKTLFAKFGEIEAGPIGFDMQTGKSRGFALFVYKTQEGAAMALQEPYKMFEGHQLHCKKATNPSQKGKFAAPAPVATPAALLGAAQQPVLAAVAAAQNLALYSQNPAYAALLGQNPLFAAMALNPATAAAAMNPVDAAVFSQAAALGAPQGQGYGRADTGAGANSLLGAYGSQDPAGLLGLQSYQGFQFGQSSSARPGSSFGGYPSYL